MSRFECDYTTGAHPKIVEALVNSNGEACPGYGVDIHCERARAMLRELCQAPEAGVHFLVGGTQANATVIAAALRPHQGVLCAETGHINVHETGAIEATGHKVLALPAENGKITARQILKTKEELYHILAEHSGVTAEKIEQDADRDFWMTSAEAAEYGLIDGVLTKREGL